MHFENCTRIKKSFTRPRSLPARRPAAMRGRKAGLLRQREHDYGVGRTHSRTRDPALVTPELLRAAHISTLTQASERKASRQNRDLLRDTRLTLARTSRQRGTLRSGRSAASASGGVVAARTLLAAAVESTGRSSGSSTNRRRAGQAPSSSSSSSSSRKSKKSSSRNTLPSYARPTRRAQRALELAAGDVKAIHSPYARSGGGSGSRSRRQASQGLSVRERVERASTSTSASSRGGAATRRGGGVSLPLEAEALSTRPSRCDLCIFRRLV